MKLFCCAPVIECIWMVLILWNSFNFSVNFLMGQSWPLFCSFSIFLLQTTCSERTHFPRMHQVCPQWRKSRQRWQIHFRRKQVQSKLHTQNFKSRIQPRPWWTPTTTAEFTKLWEKSCSLHEDSNYYRRNWRWGCLPLERQLLSTGNDHWI